MSAPVVEGKASFALHGHNPDVLTCIANLSNDEVFTPPEFANQMLDTLEQAWAESNDGAVIWADPTVTFLDPFTKSGVFLREITRRLTDGLADAIPDLEERVDHILTKQVFGIAITQLTALLARRSVYCSRDATGPHSIAKSFDRDWGNIWFERTEHTWTGRRRERRAHPVTGEEQMVGVVGTGRCEYCGASEADYSRGDALESHAYTFIHTDDIKARMAELFGDDMQFDVIIGNPPYQLGDGGAAASARPIYHSFVTQAVALEPRFAVMVTPSRWFSGGKGLDDFRSTMLGDRRLREIVDYIIDKDAFPNVNVNGGVSYFLWDRDSPGDCAVTTVVPGGVRGKTVTRPLGEFDIFVRRNEAVSILRKVRAVGEQTFERRVSSRKPFGLPTDFHGADSRSASRPIRLHGSGRVTWVARTQLVTNVDWVDRWKVLVARATDGNEKYPLPIWDLRGPFVAGPSEACSETYLVAALLQDEETAHRVVSYMRTRFFRFLVSLRKITQDNKADVFAFVPDVPLDRDWSDAELYSRYGLNADEVTFIESQIRVGTFGERLQFGGQNDV